jgi:NADH:ubiquinone oxidoreductase subunit 2 (subunit N)
MPDWVLLLPILFPPVGALVLALIMPRAAAPARVLLPILFLAIEIAAIAANAAPGSHTLLISIWDLASYTLALQLDGVSFLLLLAMFVPLVALWLVAPPRATFGLLQSLVLVAAILLTTSANLITVYFAWALFDLAILAWRFAQEIEREGALRAFAVSQTAALALCGGALMLGSARAADSASLIALGFWARLALFPFHWTLPARGSDAYDLWFARGVPLLAGSNLWLHWWTLRADVPLTLIGTLAAVALIAATFWIWSEEQPARAAVVGIAHSTAFVPLAIAFGGGAALALAMWLTLSAAIALALFEFALRWRAENRNRYPRALWFVALFSLAGLPLTPAFLGRLGLYVALWQAGEGLLLLLASAATMLTLAPMWNLGFDLRGAENRAPTRAERAALLLLTLVFVALALAPTLIAHALAPNVGEAAEGALDRVVRTDDALSVGVGLGALFLPVIASYFLSGVNRVYFPRLDAFLQRAARAFDLDWVARVMTRVGLQVGALARRASTIAEENPTVWILLAGLWIAIFISIFR